jgi:uncharacterized protein YbjT (DUF2867 family)
VHLVFTSVGSANRGTGVPHFDSKYEVEKHIAKIGVRAAILAPVFLMENLYFGKEQLAQGVYGAPLPGTRQQDVRVVRPRRLHGRPRGAPS